MNNLILFINQFLSYLLVMAVIFVVAACAFFIGLKLRKSKDLKMAQQALEGKEQDVKESNMQ